MYDVDLAFLYMNFWERKSLSSAPPEQRSFPFANHHCFSRWQILSSYQPQPHATNTDKYIQSGRCNSEIIQAEKIVGDVFLRSKGKNQSYFFSFNKVTSMTKTLDSSNAYNLNVNLGIVNYIFALQKY